MQTSRTMTTFVKNVMCLLKRTKMLQKEVTAALGMAEQHFGDLLNRQTNTILETIEAVADVLEVSLGSSIDRPAKKKTAAT